MAMLNSQRVLNMYLKYDKTDISVAFHYWKYQFYQVCHFAIDGYCGKPNDNDEPSQTSEEMVGN